MKNESLLITEENYQKLSRLLHNANPEVSALLEEELGRASIVAESEVPHNVVTMNSTLRYLDVETNKESEVTLVYPQDADLEKNKLSVLAPIGVALIGLKEGQSIHWKLPNGTQRWIRIVSVLKQGLTSDN